ncbi:MAG: histidinol phosphatase [Ilumatobacteraceae bacterium]|jgi:histidinol-phosphatase|nr:histidinol phosphatase [Ilumatobacteraceae bacterium]MDP4937049.1 histidinol phosphatase [Ilumatobacteraceae bacterium]MDP5114556.1 histidinol phosphatase [Ilumatobacteraceae bacterium]
MTSAPDINLADELSLAIRIADAADAVSLPYFERQNFTLSRKADHSEVTEADRNTETVIVDLIAKHRPDHAIYGEEHGHAGNAASPWKWVIDPIDGTSNFVRGVPVWATLIALVHDVDGPVMGVISAPALPRRWWAAQGIGAFANGRPMRVSEVSNISEAQVSVTFNSGWDQTGGTQALVALQQRAYRARGYGDFWQHMLVAEGAVDIAIDAIGLAPYDNAAVQAIVEVAGGRHTDRFGVRDYEQNSAISTNGRLHDEVITSLKV